MFNIAICDDEPFFVAEISNLLDEILSKHNIMYKLHKFNSGDELITYFEKNMHDCDLLLLDVLISKDNGINIAAHLRKIGYKANIIIVSRSEDYLLDSYRIEPISYILKPIDKDKLEEAIVRAYKKTSTKKLVIQTPSSLNSISFEDILYIEIYNKTLTIHTINDQIELTMTLSSILKKLPSDQFIQCHRSYIVSFNAIQSIKRYEITLKDNSIIPVSKLYYKNVQDELLKWAH
jgi:DNA-binding LytR/AlgR family response regulator